MIDRFVGPIEHLNTLPDDVIINTSNTFVEVRPDLGLADGTGILEFPEHFSVTRLNDTLRVTNLDLPNTSGGEVILRLGPGESKITNLHVETTNAGIEVVGTPELLLKFGGQVSLKSMRGPDWMTDGPASEIGVGYLMADGNLRINASRIRRFSPIVARNSVLLP